MTTRQQIIDFARTLVETRFHHQGRLPGVGLDCIGVIACTAQHFGLTFHDLPGYPARPDGVTLLREFDKCLTRIKHSEVQPGDVLTFWCETPGMVQHAALATDRGIIHAHIKYRRVVEHAMDTEWQSKLSICFRYPGVTDDYPKKFQWQMVDPRVQAMVQRQQAAMGIPCCGG
jgi:cell wall-associated NlpC family hydrolase